MTLIAMAGALALAAAALLIASTGQAAVPPQYAAGIAENPCSPGTVIVVPATRKAAYYPDSSVLTSARRCVRAAVSADRAWLAAGTVPGDGSLRPMAVRALLDLRLSVRPDGAVIAGWHGGYEYSWPRDSSWVAAALVSTGHAADAYRVLGFLRRTQLPDGTWAARYRQDGAPVSDGRPSEPDADGWVPWAVWTWSRHATRAQLRTLWPMVAAAAGAAERSLTADGLPAPAMDYWEDSAEVTLGTAAPLLAGLRACVAIASELGHGAQARGCDAAARRLGDGIKAGFERHGYHRQAFQSAGDDAAVTFLGPPFGPATPALRRAVAGTLRALTLPGGGILPGSAWHGNRKIAWTAETEFFALYSAETGDHAEAARLLGWAAAHRTELGALPEMVDSGGRPVSVAPLAWADAVVLLALVAQRHPLPGMS